MRYLQRCPILRHPGPPRLPSLIWQLSKCLHQTKTLLSSFLEQVTCLVSTDTSLARLQAAQEEKNDQRRRNCCRLLDTFHVQLGA